MLIKFMCEEKWWEITISLGDSSCVSELLDGPRVYRKPLCRAQVPVRLQVSITSLWSPQLNTGL